MKNLHLFFLGWVYGFIVALGIANVVDGLPFGGPAWVSLGCSVAMALVFALTPVTRR